MYVAPTEGEDKTKVQRRDFPSRCQPSTFLLSSGLFVHVPGEVLAYFLSSRLLLFNFMFAKSLIFLEKLGFSGG